MQQKSALLAIIDQRLAVLDRGARKRAGRTGKPIAPPPLKVLPRYSPAGRAGDRIGNGDRAPCQLHDLIIAKSRSVTYGRSRFLIISLFGWKSLAAKSALDGDNGGHDLLPGAVRAALGHSSGTGGYTQVPSPRPPNDFPGKVAGNATLIFSALGKMPRYTQPVNCEADDKVKVASDDRSHQPLRPPLQQQRRLPRLPVATPPAMTLIHPGDEKVILGDSRFFAKACRVATLPAKNQWHEVTRALTPKHHPLL